MNLKLKTQKRPAEIKFSDGHSMSGNFFVSPSSNGHPGSENVFELLNDSRFYIPFELPGGEVALLQKGSIMTVRMTIIEKPRDLPYLNRISTRIILVSGEVIAGYVYSDLPKSHRRLSDFLNFSQKFFSINVDEQDFLINTKFVKMVRPGR